MEATSEMTYKESHPEILATHAFACGYSLGHEKSERSIKLYLQALSHPEYENTVEWLFGLAFVK